MRVYVARQVRARQAGVARAHGFAESDRISGVGFDMRRRIDDDEERPPWGWRLTKGVLTGIVVCGAAVAAISIYVLPPPAPPPPAQTASGDPKVVDGIEVSSGPAYFGQAEPGDDATTEPEAVSDEVPTGPIELSGPALAVNAAPFEAAPDEPLLAVVLDDAGADPLLHETLFALDMPLTIGVVAGAAGDVVTARKAQNAGFEVVAELPLARPDASEGAVLEYGMDAQLAAERTMLLMRRLPMAVAATRPLAALAPPDGRMLDGILDALGPLGFAYLVHGVEPGALPPMISDGLDRIVAVSRFTIPAGATAADAHGILDRASAEAEERGGAIVVAKAEEPILLALQLWGGDEAVTTTRLAPFSAVVRRQHGGDAPAELTAEGAEGDEPEAEEPEGAEPEAAAVETDAAATSN